jgi:hypothetical protein
MIPFYDESNFWNVAAKSSFRISSSLAVAADEGGNKMGNKSSATNENSTSSQHSFDNTLLIDKLKRQKEETNKLLQKSKAKQNEILNS